MRQVCAEQRHLAVNYYAVTFYFKNLIEVIYVLLLLERARLIHLWIASRYALNAANNMFAKHCVSFFSIGQV